MRILVVAWTVALLLSGCAQTAQLSSSFNQQEAQYIRTKGKAQISGQLFLRRNDGVVVYGAGSTVSLIPSTGYARERIKAIYGAAKYRAATVPLKFENEDPAYAEFIRTTKADGQGNFSFTEVAPGDYFVSGLVTWCVPSQLGCLTQGGALMENAKITSAEMNGQ
jgi:hypothetical protein